MNEQEKRLGWHILPADMHLNAVHNGDDRVVKIGKTLSVEGVISCCVHGLHACERAVDALSYAPDARIVFTRVESWGDIDEESNKYAARNRKVLWVVSSENTVRVVVQWALECAKQALERERAAGREPDARSWAAVEAGEGWLNGTVTKEELQNTTANANAAAFANAAYAYAYANAANAAAFAAANANAAAFAANAANAAAAFAAFATYAAAAFANANANAAAQMNKRLETLLEAHAEYEVTNE